MRGQPMTQVQTSTAAAEEHLSREVPSLRYLMVEAWMRLSVLVATAKKTDMAALAEGGLPATVVAVLPSLQTVSMAAAVRTPYRQTVVRG